MVVALFVDIGHVVAFLIKEVEMTFPSQVIPTFDFLPHSLKSSADGR